MTLFETDRSVGGEWWTRERPKAEAGQRSEGTAQPVVGGRPATARQPKGSRVGAIGTALAEAAGVGPLAPKCAPGPPTEPAGTPTQAAAGKIGPQPSRAASEVPSASRLGVGASFDWDQIARGKGKVYWARAWIRRNLGARKAGKAKHEARSRRHRDNERLCRLQ